MEAMLRSLLLDIINIMINGCMDKVWNMVMGTPGSQTNISLIVV